MKISVLGTGIVGQIIAGKMVRLGHEVSMGTRNPQVTLENKQPNRMTGVVFSNWHEMNKEIRLEPFTDVANGAEIVVNATSGLASLDILELVGERKLEGKILIDIANPLDFSQGYLRLNVVNTDSLGEQIQRKFPNTKVVKTLNTMNASIMVNPDSIQGDHNVFMSGNDSQAKVIVAELLQAMGWKMENIVDLGDIKTARGAEMLLPVWLQLYTVMGTPNFNFHIQRGK